MEWAIVSAGCAVIGLIVHGWDSWQNAKTRAAIAELKVEIIDRQKTESERTRDLIAPLGTEVAAMGARLDALSGEVHYLRGAES